MSSGVHADTIMSHCATRLGTKSFLFTAMRTPPMPLHTPTLFFSSPSPVPTWQPPDAALSLFANCETVNFLTVPTASRSFPARRCCVPYLFFNESLLGLVVKLSCLYGVITIIIYCIRLTQLFLGLDQVKLAELRSEIADDTE